MSKTVGTALKAAMALQVTTLCTCWNITRRDGATFFFTDHDQNIVFGGQTYIASSGYTRSAVEADNAFTVDNMEVAGILSNSEIDEHDLRNGVYDYASVEIFIVNWAALSQGKMTIRKGFFGEVVVTPTGSFKTEIRGLTQALAVNFGQVISAQCRADFGDTRCKVPVDPAVWIPSRAYPANSWVRASNLGTLPDDPAGGVIFNTAAGGQSGTTQPTWNGGGATSDGTITDWLPYNSFTKQGTVTSVISRKQIVVSGLTIPQNELYGPQANQLGIPAQITNFDIAGGGFPLGEGFNVVTCDVRLLSGNSNILTFNTDVPGGSGLVSSSGNNSQHFTLTGPFETINAILLQGLTWTDNSTFTDIATINASDDLGHTYSGSLSLPQVSPYYANATLSWVTGSNAGKAMEVNNYAANDIITLWLSMPFMPTVGDVFRIAPGCLKTRPACVGFGNMINFHGEPDLPGQDFLFAPNLDF